jgi:hypothetical protein
MGISFELDDLFLALPFKSERLFRGDKNREVGAFKKLLCHHFHYCDILQRRRDSIGASYRSISDLTNIDTSTVIQFVEYVNNYKSGDKYMDYAVQRVLAAKKIRYELLHS